MKINDVVKIKAGRWRGDGAPGAGRPGVESMSGEGEVIEEGGAELAALGGAAAALDAEIGAGDFGPAPDVPAEVGPDATAETAAVLKMAVALLSPMLPYLPEIYTEDKIIALAGAYVPVAEKYGWTSGGWFDKYGPEIVLAATALPLAFQTKQAHGAMLDARAKAAKAARAPLPQVSSAAPNEAMATLSPRDVQIGTAQPVEAAA